MLLKDISKKVKKIKNNNKTSSSLDQKLPFLIFLNFPLFYFIITKIIIFTMPHEIDSTDQKIDIQQKEALTIIKRQVIALRNRMCSYGISS